VGRKEYEASCLISMTENPSDDMEIELWGLDGYLYSKNNRQVCHCMI